MWKALFLGATLGASFSLGWLMKSAETQGLVQGLVRDCDIVCTAMKMCFEDLEMCEAAMEGEEEGDG